MSETRDRRAQQRSSDVLVVDDEADIRELVELSLLRMGLAVESAGSVAEALRMLDERQYRLCLTDMRLPDGDGLQVVRHIAERGGDLPVAVITAYGSMDNAVVALKAGAFDYLSKPVALDQLRALVKSALDVPRAKSRQGQGTVQLTGSSASMDQVRSMIERLARSQAPVYVSGESGSGKERAARLIHALGARADRPFVGVNCGAIPENLMESEFFGYRRGAFTGADSDREGFFQAADGGTLFLDEVADLPLVMQVKLLRAIQEKRVRRVGDTQEVPVDVRIISATHQNLRERVEQGRFRQDLFYRLNVIELKMPALRERAEDIPMLAQGMLERMAAEAGVQVPYLSDRALTALRNYAFPGNVRELENILERAMALCLGDEIEVDDLQLEPVDCEGAASMPALGRGAALQDYLDQVEREAINAALAQTGGNRTAAARVLGVTFRSLRYRMERLGMNGDKRDDAGQ
ncbi:MAG: sigma-54-dependent Fis family transcriptional regulator [Candidatus Dactylopiibacterium carminicum]|uniref:Sigma-54-dependent Fis family transcriptional regulator n=1 Tax=Candidatus Dactylopiibacterium carminicum TaxID=857335 RepID=A0A272ENS3_9RHOO|nr:sigma-54 dependent transcriptional regulator [Candidatus Dactylopiibacterium carminicum]KAF7597713.1 sigma-54-dependent Fis family transcriptional regulator [Candidatus Dactylopiibacterium carminicum]PAS91320.1 MAG: sigma-54-dependent Fis family transcriptional regulator [Candidatus Dactylopiibacterium carminicum]PAS92128.1 MAG: sigma-54-dependent Fis family transcriptional regulator [Candidatus Dactylopiibacterium carminicum]PAS94536.1 MAG: sigma-54-dependent Fis family transcriptional regu